LGKEREKKHATLNVVPVPVERKRKFCLVLTGGKREQYSGECQASRSWKKKKEGGRKSPATQVAVPYLRREKKCGKKKQSLRATPREKNHGLRGT